MSSPIARLLGAAPGRYPADVIRVGPVSTRIVLLSGITFSVDNVRCIGSKCVPVVQFCTNGSILEK